MVHQVSLKSGNSRLNVIAASLRKGGDCILTGTSEPTSLQQAPETLGARMLAEEVDLSPRVLRQPL